MPISYHCPNTFQMDSYCEKNCKTNDKGLKFIHDFKNSQKKIRTNKKIVKEYEKAIQEEQI